MLVSCPFNAVGSGLDPIYHNSTCMGLKQAFLGKSETKSSFD